MATVVFFHAHPDDEAITTGGTMALLAEAGHRVVLVTATRGELGEVPEDLGPSGQSLAERRSDELAAACRVLGVARLEFLGYGDSGMAGEPTNQAEGAFAAVDVDEAGERLAELLRGERAEVLVIYDEHGGYGHPDHVQVHRVGMRAADLAGTPRLYFTTLDRDAMRALTGEWAARVAAEPGPPGVDGAEGWVPPEVPEFPDDMGEPGSRITTEVDVVAAIDRKRRAMEAHPSQIADTSFFLAMPGDVFELVWGREWYIRARPEAPDPFVGPREGGLLGSGV